MGKQSSSLGPTLALEKRQPWIWPREVRIKAPFVVVAAAVVNIRGIGFASFCSHTSFPGARVILACRDLTRARLAADEIRQLSGNGNVVVKKLDLASLQSVRDLAKDVEENEERLDVLINNAGKLQLFSLL